MSWQAYIDTSLVGTGEVDSAAIFSVDGKDNWAHSDNFAIKPAEIQEIINAYTNPDKVFAEGIHINGVKFQIIKVEDPSIYAKKGKEGFIIVKSKLAIILAHHPDTGTTQACAVVVEKLAEYLRSVGY